MKTAAYTAINTLVLTAHSLPQTLEQISQQLHELQAAGQVVSTDGAHTTDGQLASTHGALRRAGEHAPPPWRTHCMMPGWRSAAW
ncbi:MULTISPECIES: hypothetical protein [unclassified Streptomyces]|uniref:hypothetical protein n=1 Tax=unclassified Streptomyces TaxID=2593676 RepID=UPI00225B90C0|nr:MULTISPECIES: hypothetical protein [unclassified Streptomyces]MCX5104308.1 hypothetical protein [Streptomyces sp. NBC_00439]WSC26217.1 hypothetical protein OG902_05795 [Streptomyces sp. NBC_01768]